MGTKNSQLNQGKPGLTVLQEKYARKLEGARFRMINESLYKSNGHEAFSEFQNDPSKFEIYHRGFRYLYFFMYVVVITDSQPRGIKTVSKQPNGPKIRLIIL